MNMVRVVRVTTVILFKMKLRIYCFDNRTQYDENDHDNNGFYNSNTNDNDDNNGDKVNDNLQNQ